MKRRTRLAAALARRFLVMSLLPILLIGAFGAYQMSGVLVSGIHARNRLIASSAAQGVSAFLDTPADALEHIGRVHVDEGPAEIDSTLENAVEDFEFFESIQLVGDDGRVEAVAIRTGIGARAQDMIGLDRTRDSQYITALETGDISWSGVATSLVSGQRILRVAVPSREGVVMATVDIESLAGAVRRQNDDASVRIVIMDSAGSVLFHTDPRIAETRPNWSNLGPVKAGLAGVEVDSRFVRSGAEFFGSTALVPGVQWTVLAEQPWSDAVRPIYAIELSILFIVSLMAAIAVLAATHSARVFGRPIEEIEGVADRIAGGDYATWDQSYRFVELDNLSRSVSQMASAVARREASLTEALEELTRANERISAMSAELVTTEEHERRHLAEELHDRVSQVLAVAGMRLGILEGSGSGQDENLQQARALVKQAIDESRALTSELFPPVLHELGLGAALRAMGERMESEHGIAITVETDVDESLLEDATRTSLFRAGRELVTNAVKHASASRIEVRLFEQDEYIVLVVQDDGIGFDAAQSLEGIASACTFGIFSIKQRLIRLGGTLTFASDPGCGATATIRVPRMVQDPRESSG